MRRTPTPTPSAPAKRREFLRHSAAFIGVSAAVSVAPGCASSPSATLASAPVSKLGPDFPLATGRGWKFPQSVASADPKPDSIVLWTRVVRRGDDNVKSSSAGAFAIQLRVTATDHSASLGSDAALTGPFVVDDVLPVSPTHDHSVRRKVTGLQPGQVYFYQFTAGAARSNIGRFKTAPAVNSQPAKLDFAVLSCQDWSVNHWGVLEDVAQQPLDFFIHIGDYIYETVGADFQRTPVEARHPKLVLPDGTPQPGKGRYATSLTDYRYLYKSYRSDPRLQAVHERFAMIAMWDDHEFSDDCWGDAETYTHSDPADPATNRKQPQRRRAANQAWFEYMPADVAPLDLRPEAGIFNVKLYRDFHFGQLAHLLMTDERLYRSDHVIAEGTINPATGKAVGSIGARYMAPEQQLLALQQQKMQASASGGDPLANVSILGRTQRQWWKDTLQHSKATWKLWGNEVSLLQMAVHGQHAIATLGALSAVESLTKAIAQEQKEQSVSLPVAAATIAAKTAGASLEVARAAARSLPAQPTGLSAAQTQIAIAAINASQPATGVSASAQAAGGARAIAFGHIQPDIMANGAAAQSLPADQRATFAPFMQKFLINADQWDGYTAERNDLMRHLQQHHIQNVVALTGDIHAFFAGSVMDDYQSTTPKPVMVDLVTAGVSSDSFFTYLKDEVGNIAKSLSVLVYYPLPIPVPLLGTITVNVSLLDYTLGLPAPTPSELAESLAVKIRGELAKKGVPESLLDWLTRKVVSGLAENSDFVHKLTPLAATLSSLKSNPGLAWARTDAQGYARVTVTPERVVYECREANRLVGDRAPKTIIARSRTATVESGQPVVKMS